MSANGKNANIADLQLVIMAAGMGSRYGGLKQIDEFGPAQAFLMDYAIFDAIHLGVRKICIVIRKSFAAQIEARMRAKWGGRNDVEIRFVCQEIDELPAGFRVPEGREKPWGTTHVLYVLKEHIDTPFFIMNADDYYGRPALARLTSYLAAHPGHHALAGYPLQQTLSPHGPVTRGVCEVRDGRLTAIEEVAKIPPNDPRQALVSMNLWGFSPSIFESVEEAFAHFLSTNTDRLKGEYQIPHLINDLLKAGKIIVDVLPVESPWFGVTYPEDKPEVQNKIVRMIENGEYPHNLFQEPTV
jgi:dTDP-glucose pyrophosphorylase